jgi:hypothetical protein
VRAALLLAALSACATAQTYRIAGVLVDGQTGKPILRGHITLTGGRESMAVTTEADGAFSFDVPQGKYSLNTEVHNWHQVYGMAGPSVGFGSSIITGPDQDTGHLIYRFFRPGSIYGRVTDDHGEAIENATVQGIREYVAAGKKVTSVAWTARTDDRGMYRMGPVAAGTYYLVATATPWYTDPQHLIGQAEGESAFNMAYATTFYPGSTDARQAGRLKVESGGETQANLAMETVPGVTVHPVCASEKCGGSITFSAVGVGGLEVLVATRYFMQNPAIQQSLPGIAPGHYVVRVTGEGGAMRKVVDLAGGDATVSVSFQPPPKITGTVTYKNGVNPRGPAFITMVNENTNTAVGLTIGADGSFSYANPPLARFRPVFGGAAGFFISQMSASGAEIHDGTFELVEGSPVELTIEASSDSGRVKGLVMNGEKPVAGVLVVLAPRDKATAAIPPRGFQTDSDGSYDFTNVPVGDYLLFTTERMDLEYAIASAIEPYLAAATAVRIESHKVLTENLNMPGK